MDSPLLGTGEYACPKSAACALAPSEATEHSCGVFGGLGGMLHHAASQRIHKDRQQMQIQHVRVMHEEQKKTVYKQLVCVTE